MVRKMLLDSCCVSGYNLEGFKKNVKKYADATGALSVKGKDITILSLCQVPRYQMEGKVMFYILTEEYVEDFVVYGEKLRLGSIGIEEIGEDLLKELKESTGLMLIVDDEKYIVSRSTMTTLAQRACISGDTTVNRGNLARDLHLADGLFHRNETITFVYRHAEGINKIFAAFSNDYNLNKQDIIIDALEDEAFPFSEFTVRGYSIDNSLTELELDLPAQGDLIPGLIIRNSDIGISSLVVRTTYRYGDSYVICSESLMRHDRTMTYDKFMNKILPEAKEYLDNSLFAEEMEKLRNIYVIDYSCFDPTLPLERYRNCTEVKMLVKDTLYAMLYDVLSKKCLKNLCRQLWDAIDDGKQYSLFDIAVMLFSVCQRLDLDASTIAYTRKALAKTPAYLVSLSGCYERVAATA